MKAYLKDIETVIQNGFFKDNWESLQQYNPPKWYQDFKFGIFIHWGVYSVPAFGNEWYARNMYMEEKPEYNHHLDNYGEHIKFGYKDFIPQFKGENFEAEKWAVLFREAGAQYVLPVAEHHDGFQMYRSKLSHWNAYEMGPKRDVLGELKSAFNKEELVLGASSHRIEHWFFMGHGKKFSSDVKNNLEKEDLYWPAEEESDHYDLQSKPTPSKEFLENWLIRTCEIIDQYQPKLLYFDWWIQHESVKPYLQKLAAYYYNRAIEWGTEVVINYKHDAFMFGTAIVDIERGQFADTKPFIWQTDTAIALNSWCYTKNNQYKSAEAILCDLVDIVSKNGRLLLNVGPKADGTITEEEKTILLEIGNWLKNNGEAIYGAKVWRQYGEGPTEIGEGQFFDSIEKKFTSSDVRYTVNGSAIYAIALSKSEDNTYCFPALGKFRGKVKPDFTGIIKTVTQLSEDSSIKWQQTVNGLNIQINDNSIQYPIVFKVELK